MSWETWTTFIIYKYLHVKQIFIIYHRGLPGNHNKQLYSEQWDRHMSERNTSPSSNKEKHSGVKPASSGDLFHNNKLERHTLVSMCISEWWSKSILGILSWYKHTDTCVLNLAYAEHQELDVHQINHSHLWTKNNQEISSRIREAINKTQVWGK